MGTGGKIRLPKTQPIYIVAAESNSGYNLVFSDEDVHLDAARAKAWCDQKNARYPERKSVYQVVTFNARV